MREVRRAGVVAVAVMTAWWLVVYGFGSLPLPWLSPAAFPHLGVVVVNLLGLLAAVVVALGLRARGWLPRLRLVELAGATGPKQNAVRRPAPRLWLSLVGILALAPALVGRAGVPGISGTPLALGSSAVGLLAVGLSEEVTARGFALTAFLRAGRTWVGVLVTSTLFGLWHLGNTVFFGQSLTDGSWQVLQTFAFGVAFAGIRLHLQTLWPLIVLHAAWDWFQLNSPGATPFWFQCLSIGALLLIGITATAQLRNTPGKVRRDPRPTG